MLTGPYLLLSLSGRLLMSYLFMRGHSSINLAHTHEFATTISRAKRVGWAWFERLLCSHIQGHIPNLLSSRQQHMESIAEWARNLVFSRSQ